MLHKHNCNKSYQLLSSKLQKWFLQYYQPKYKQTKPLNPHTEASKKEGMRWTQKAEIATELFWLKSS